MGNLLLQMRKVRETTIQVCEAYGAWARLLHKEKVKKKGGVSNRDEVNAAKKRTYCVNIAMRGPMVYPQVRTRRPLSLSPSLLRCGDDDDDDGGGVQY